MGNIFEKMGLIEKSDKSENDKTSKKPVEKTPVQKSTPQSTSSLQTPSLSSSPIPAVIVDGEKYAEFLKKVFNERNFPGPDYQEFITGLNSLSGLQIDEKTKFITCFAPLQAQGVTKDLLIETANKYIGIFKEQLAGFKADYEQTFNEEVGGKSKEIETLNAEIAEYDKQVNALFELKNRSLEKIARLTAEVQANQQSLQSKDAAFTAQVNHFVNEINSNINKIQQYL